MNNKLINKINTQFDEIEKDLAKIHKLSSATKTISSICEIQETKEDIIAKQKTIIDLLDIDTLEVHVLDKFVTRLENTAKAVQSLK